MPILSKLEFAPLQRTSSFQFDVRIDKEDLQYAVFTLQSKCLQRMSSTWMIKKALLEFLREQKLVDYYEMQPLLKNKETIELIVELCNIFMHNEPKVFEGFLKVLCNLEPHAKRYREIIETYLPGSVKRVIYKSKRSLNEETTDFDERLSKKSRSELALSIQSLDPSVAVTLRERSTNVQKQKERPLSCLNEMKFMEYHECMLSQNDFDSVVQTHHSRDAEIIEIEGSEHTKLINDAPEDSCSVAVDENLASNPASENFDDQKGRKKLKAKRTKFNAKFQILKKAAKVVGVGALVYLTGSNIYSNIATKSDTQVVDMSTIAYGNLTRNFATIEKTINMPNLTAMEVKLPSGESRYRHARNRILMR